LRKGTESTRNDESKHGSSEQYPAHEPTRDTPRIANALLHLYTQQT
jgi:hypothetical protein